jgi:hypothetical protein
VRNDAASPLNVGTEAILATLGPGAILATLGPGSAAVPAWVGVDIPATAISDEWLDENPAAVAALTHAAATATTTKTTRRRPARLPPEPACDCLPLRDRLRLVTDNPFERFGSAEVRTIRGNRVTQEG